MSVTTYVVMIIGQKIKAIHAVESLTLLLAIRSKSRIMYSFSVSDLHMNLVKWTTVLIAI